MRPMLEFKAFHTAHGTLVGSALMHMLETLQMVVEEGAERLTATEQFYAFAPCSPRRSCQLPSNRLHTNPGQSQDR